MQLKGIVAEDFVNYKLPSLFLITSVCDWKCCKEANIDISVCQNQPMVNQPTHDISADTICTAYLKNDITKAIVFGGLEPFKQFSEMLEIIKMLRKDYMCSDPIVIYTGYYPDELHDEMKALKEYNNIIIKYGRYIPNRPSRYDEVLGITLVSDNQYAEKIS